MKKALLFFSGCIIYSIIAAQPTAGLKAYWRMDGNFTDSTSNAINGTNSGATATTNNLSVANKAMNFANPTSTPAQFATHTSNANLNFGASQDFSVDFSFYLTGPYAHYCGLYDNNLNYGGYGIWTWNSNGFIQVQFNFRNTSVGTTSATGLVVNTWYKVTCLRSGSTMSIYINGVLNNSITVGTTTPSYTFGARFGSMFFDAQTPKEYNPLHGKLDEMRIYNRALTQAEITQLYNVWLTPTVPVKLSSFTAVKDKQAVVLNWQTQSEQNSSHFIIQRSDDGIRFTDITTVQAKGNTNTVSNYSYTDMLTNAFSSTVFYRLKAVDVDGKYSYSSVVSIHLLKENITLLVSPNPAKDILQVQIGKGLTGKTAVAIVAINGKQLFAKELQLQSTTTNIPINISMLAKGSYMLTVSNANNKWTEQFVKE